MAPGVTSHPDLLGQTVVVIGERSGIGIETACTPLPWEPTWSSTRAFQTAYEVRPTRSRRATRQPSTSPISLTSLHDSSGDFHHSGTVGRVTGADPQRRSWASYAAVNDPHGNGWLLQEITERLPGR
jgi:hypothetical protein